MRPEIIQGDILDQDVEVIVNSGNRNIVPWWLLLPHGVSGAIKKRGGTAPFKEVSQYGPIPLGEARLTSSGTLAFKKIIHVAGINIFWCATQYSVTRSVINAMRLVNEEGYKSVAFPLIGSGSGNRGKEWSLDLMLKACEEVETEERVFIVQYEEGSRK